MSWRSPETLIAIKNGLEMAQRSHIFPLFPEDMTQGEFDG